jgi:AcrR family transcriptional regulator
VVVSRARSERHLRRERGVGRARIVAEAAGIFLERGFADTSMQQIADAAGVTKAALYYHFASKEELFGVVVQNGVNALWEGIIARAEAGGPLRSTLRDIVVYLSDTVNIMNVSSIVEDVRRFLPPERLLEIFTEHPTPDEALGQLFARAVASGEMRALPNLNVVAAIFGGMAMGLLHRGHEHAVPTPEETELLLDVFLHGVAPRDTTTAAATSAQRSPARGQRLGRQQQFRGGQRRPRSNAD